jgi:hypothetical protein
MARDGIFQRPAAVALAANTTQASVATVERMSNIEKSPSSSANELPAQHE